MATKPRIVTVLGATGTQGGAVVDALLSDGTFTPRAITRDDASASAKALKSKGAEVVKAHPEDLESLRDAIHGSEALFLVTVPFIEQTEIDQAQKVIQASKDAGVKFIVFSSLPDMTKETGGKCTTAAFFDMKARIEEHLQASGIPHAIVYTGHFLENAWKFGFLRKSTAHPGDLEYLVPGAHLDTVSPYSWIEHDLGSTALVLFQNYKTKPTEVLGGKFHVLTERATAEHYCNMLSETLGQKVHLAENTKSGNPALDDASEAHREFGLYPKATIPDPNLVKLGVKFGSIAEFLSVNKERLLGVVPQ